MHLFQEKNREEGGWICHSIHSSPSSVHLSISFSIPLLHYFKIKTICVSKKEGKVEKRSVSGTAAIVNDH